MRRVAIACGLLLLVSATIAAFAQGQSPGPVVFTRTQPGPTAWSLKPGVRITPASRSVTIVFFADGYCYQDAGIDVQQTAGAVTIDKLITGYSGTDGTYPVAIACPTSAPREEQVDLGGPLGNRVILDGSTSPPTQRYPVAATPTPESIGDVYARLHRRGLPITFDQAFPLSSASRYTTHVTGTERVRRHGRKVLLAHVAQDPASLMPAINPGAVPRFRGRPLSAAAAWADAHYEQWSAGTPPRLVAATRRHLLANYVVTRQHTQSPPLVFAVRLRDHALPVQRHG